MIMDVAGPQFDIEDIEDIEELPNSKAKQFYDMLAAADKELWPGCKNHSQLSFVARLMSLKSENHMSERCFDQMIELIQEILPEDNLAPDNFYETKKLLRGMGLPVEKIDCCPNNCMIYWRDDAELVCCKFCNTSRFKENNEESESGKQKQVPAMKMYYFPLTPRLQRLYASKATANDMRWPLTEIKTYTPLNTLRNPRWHVLIFRS
ncbi:uncharacterized protein LOC130990427 [Salvia miltiorrhiza]|uniref:uncharacterized protein LOC130990427 n=1 Tax=Salvia miltiorrhiza TaxID=226208 RepID=UPI0025ABB0DB|nr:uncharacterized protein LOC130990427 [Salvia miltiorrhiza]